MSNKKEEKIEIDEDRAYFELCQIIAEAIQTQDINLLQSRIEDWKKRYPYNKFSKNLKAKIDYILNQYYSELIEYIIKSIKQEEKNKEFNQSKSLVELYKIIKSTNDIKELNKKVNEWKSKYPIDNFLKMYKSKVERYTSKKYLEENAFDTDKAFYELYYLLKTNASYDELKERVSIWEKDYSIGDKYSIDDFKKNSSEVKTLLDDEYLYSISNENEKADTLAQKENSLAIQSSIYSDFETILKTGNKAEILEWIYKNRNISFGNYYKEQLVSKTAFKYPISELESNKFKMNLNERGLSFEEYENIDDSRKYVITMFINSLMKEQSMSDTTFSTAFQKSEIAKSYKSKELKEEAKESETLVVDLTKTDTNLEEKMNESIIVTNLNTQVFQNDKKDKKEESNTYIIFEPNLLLMISEKSKMAQEQNKIIPTVDKIVSKQVGEKEMPEEEINLIKNNN